MYVKSTRAGVNVRLSIHDSHYAQSYSRIVFIKTEANSGCGRESKVTTFQFFAAEMGKIESPSLWKISNLMLLLHE